jgi:hypothetical protein
VVIAAALGAYALKRRREIREHTTDADSIELALSVRARAGAMVDGLVLTLAAGLVLLIDGGALAPLVVCIAVLLTIVDFYIRYGVLTSRSRSGR